MTLSSLTQKNIFVVLGMARTGTSVITRGLKALGIDLGNHLTAENKWNPKGFWEDNEIVYKINELVLNELNMSWDSIKYMPHAPSHSNLTALQQKATSILTKRFAATAYWGFKDPRTVKILFFWQAVFQAMHLNEHYIIALRNPLAAAQSYQRLTNADIEHGLLLWLYHLFTAIEGTFEKNRILVSYEHIMQDPHSQLERIRTQLKLPDFSDAAEMAAYQNNFIDKNLRHYDSNSKELKSHTAISIAPICEKLYALLIELANDKMTFQDDTFLAAWGEIKKEFEAINPIYAYIEVLIQRSNAYNKYIKQLHKSRLWHLIAPLRKIDAFCRERRRRLKKKD